jgi:hypothetical protein
MMNGCEHHDGMLATATRKDVVVGGKESGGRGGKMERQDVASQSFTRVAIATGNAERPPLITQL